MAIGAVKIAYEVNGGHDFANDPLMWHFLVNMHIVTFGKLKKKE